MAGAHGGEQADRLSQPRVGDTHTYLPCQQLLILALLHSSVCLCPVSPSLRCNQFDRFHPSTPWSTSTRKVQSVVCTVLEDEISQNPTFGKISLWLSLKGRGLQMHNESLVFEKKKGKFRLLLKHISDQNFKSLYTECVVSNCLHKKGLLT